MASIHEFLGDTYTSGQVNLGLTTQSGTSRTIASQGSGSNINVHLLPKGTGYVSVPVGYDGNITTDDALISRGYFKVRLGLNLLSTTAQAPSVSEDGYALVWDEGSGEYTLAPSAATATFLGLTDTPDSYTGQTLKGVRVNAGETGLEFYTITASGHVIENSGTPLTNRANLNFSNGLTASDNNPDTDVKLGGNISENTTIGIDATFTLQIGNNNGALTINDSTKTVDITVGDTAFFTIGGGIDFQGAKYSADYSADFVARSLIDKGYADVTYAPISGGAYWSLASGGTLSTPNTITGSLTNTLKFVFDGIGATAPANGVGLWLANTTAATVGVRQHSPGIVYEANAWDSDNSVSRSGRIRQHLYANSPAPQVTFAYNIDASIDGAAYTTIANYTYNGTFGDSSWAVGHFAVVNTTSTASTLLYGNRFVHITSASGPSTTGYGTDIYHPLTSLTTGGLARVYGTMTRSSGSNSLTTLALNPSYVFTGTYSGTNIVLDINPTLSATTGLTNVAMRVTSGGILITGGLTTADTSSTLTANTKFDLRGTGTSTNLIQRWADSSNTVRLHITDGGTIVVPQAGLMQFGTNINTYIASFNDSTFMFQTGDSSTSGLYTYSIRSRGFTAASGLQTAVGITSALTGFAPTSGNASFTALHVGLTYNTTGTYSGGTIIGIDYNPVLTSIVGVGGHIALRAVSGQVLIGDHALSSHKISVKGTTSDNTASIYHGINSSSAVKFQVRNDGVSSLGAAINGNFTVTLGDQVGILGTTSSTLYQRADSNGADLKTWAHVVMSTGNFLIRQLTDAYTTLTTPIEITPTTSGGVGIYASPTANTRFDIRGIGTTTDTSLRIADSANAVTLTHTDAGIFTIYSNASSSTFVRLTGSGTSNITFSNTFGTTSIGIHSGAANRIWTSVGLNVAGSTNSITFTNSTGTDTGAPRLGRLAGTSGTGGIYYSAEEATLNANRILHQFSGGLIANGTTLTLQGLYLPFTFNDNGFTGHTFVGIDYAPTITGSNLTHIAARFASGQFVIGNTTAVSNNRLRVTGIGTTTGLTLLLEDSAGVDRFSFSDNGSVNFVGGTSSTGSIVTDGALYLESSNGLATFFGDTTLIQANTDIDIDGVSGTLTLQTSGGPTVVVDTLSVGSRLTIGNGDDKGIVVGSHTANHTTPVNGLIYYNSTDNKFRFRQNGAWAELGGGGGSSAGANNEVQTSDGAGGFVASKLFFDETTGAMSLGDSGLAGATRSITAVGSAADVGIDITSKGSSPIRLDGQNNGVKVADALDLYTDGTFAITFAQLYDSGATAKLTFSNHNGLVEAGLVGAANGLIQTVKGGDISSSSGAFRSGDLHLKSGDGVSGSSALSSGHVYIYSGAVLNAGNRGNIAIGESSVASWQSMERGMFISDVIVAPTGNPTNGLFKWVDATEKVAKVRDEDGEVYNETTRDGTIGVIFDSTVSAGEYIHVRVPYSGKFVSWDITTSDGASSSIVVDVRKGTYASTFPLAGGASIAGSEKPTLSSAAKNQDTSLSTWTTAFSEDDYIAFYVESVSGLTGKVHVTLKLLKNS